MLTSKEGFDLAIRIGKLANSQLKAQKLGEIKLILVASPEYLKNNKIKKIEEKKLVFYRFVTLNLFQGPLHRKNIIFC